MSQRCPVRTLSFFKHNSLICERILKIEVGIESNRCNGSYGLKMNDFKSVVKKLSSVFFCKLSRSHPAAYREMPHIKVIEVALR